MFKSARWRSERNKIKVVFKLQFHATQVSQLNVDGLALSVVPMDVGKPTARLEKAAIKEGCCRWESRVYETVRFSQDAKTKKISDKLCSFLVSTGLSNNNLIGEVSINFADYAEATKISVVSLPLKNTKSNMILHVSIQRLEADGGQRELVEPEDTVTKAHSKTLNSLLSNDEPEEGIHKTSNEETKLNNGHHNAETNACQTVSSGSDMTASSSGSSSGLDTPREVGLRIISITEDPASFLSSQGHTSVLHKLSANESGTVYQKQQQSQRNALVDSDQGTSTDDTTNDSHQASDSEIRKLKEEVVALSRQVDVSELELQTLRKQIVRESKKGQDLSREVATLKEERELLKTECEELKAIQKQIEQTKSKNKLQFESGDPWILLEDIRQELGYEKDINANLRVQLQKTQESNAELLLAVKDLDEMLEQKNKEIQDRSDRPSFVCNIVSGSDSDDDEEQKALIALVKEHSDAKETYELEQRIMDLCTEIEIYRRDKDELEMQMEQLALDYEILKQQNHDISYKLEQSQLQEKLKMQCECSLSLANISDLEARIESSESELKTQSKDYSSSLDTINELKNHIKDLEEELDKQSQGFETSSLAKISDLEARIESLECELKTQSKDYSHSLDTISELRNHIKDLEEELEKQSQGFETDLEALTRARVEQEQRAIRAEEALRKTRLKNANTAEKLQEEFRKLTVQMTASFNANEKITMKALAEASELGIQRSELELMLHNAKKELVSARDDYEAKLLDLQNQINSKKDQIEQLSADVEDRSKQLEHQKVHVEELARAFSQEISILKAEMEKLSIANGTLSEASVEKEIMRKEVEDMKVSLTHAEAQVERGNIERNEFVSTIALMKNEAEKSLENLNRMRCLLDKKEASMGLLQAKVETLQAEHNQLKNSLSEYEIVKEKLVKQVLQLKDDLKRKEYEFVCIKKKLEQINNHVTSEEIELLVRSDRSSPADYNPEEVASLTEKINLLEGQIKLKEIALGTSTDRFLEKERELQEEIEELESRVGELCQDGALISDNSNQKLAMEIRAITSDLDMHESSGNTDENPASTACMSKGDTGESVCNKEALLSELESLKERNKSMEGELKELQGRYSEISLKFAEVEGERQQLVMKMRSLKNAKKR